MKPMVNVHELAQLSLGTAQQVDLQLSGEAGNAAILSQFGSALTHLSGVGDPNVRAFLSSDPTTTEIFAQAVGELTSEEISDIDALSAVMKEIVGPLMQAERELSPEALRTIKSFSLAFHRALLAHQFIGLPDDEILIGNEYRVS